MDGIYLDYNGSAPLDPRVAEVMRQALTEGLGNASAVHRFGRRQTAAVDEARDHVAAMVGGRPEAAEHRVPPLQSRRRPGRRHPTGPGRGVPGKRLPFRFHRAVSDHAGHGHVAGRGVRGRPVQRGPLHHHAGDRELAIEAAVTTVEFVRDTER